MVVDAVPCGELAHVQLAHQDGARILEVGYNRGVVVGNVGRQDLGAAGGEDAGGVELVFDCDGHAVKGAAIFTGGNFSFGLPCSGEGVVAADCDIAVELAVHPVDSLQVGLDSLNRGYFLTTY